MGRVMRGLASRLFRNSLDYHYSLLDYPRRKDYDISPLLYPSLRQTLASRVPLHDTHYPGSNHLGYSGRCILFPHLLEAREGSYRIQEMIDVGKVVPKKEDLIGMPGHRGRSWMDWYRGSRGCERGSDWVEVLREAYLLPEELESQLEFQILVCS